MTDIPIQYVCRERYGVMRITYPRYTVEDRADGSYLVTEYSTCGPMSRLDAVIWAAQFNFAAKLNEDLNALMEANLCRNRPNPWIKEPS